MRRVTTAEIAAWAEAIEQKVPGARLGNVVDEAGNPVPDAVMDSLDPDDDEALSEVISDFLPRRLRAVLGSQPETSTTLSPSSPES